MRNTTIIFLWTAAIVLLGCTEKLETDYKGSSDNLLVVSGEFSTDTTAHVVKLTRTVDFNSLGENSETGATVTITDLTSGNIIPLTEGDDGIYATDSNVFGSVGHTYKLNVETSDGETYYAESKIEYLTPLDSVSVKFEKEFFTGDYYYVVMFSGYEPEGTGDYYLWNLYLNDTLYNDTLTETAYSNDEFVDGNYISKMELYWVSPDEVNTDITYYTIEMESITEAYFDYLTEVEAETERGSPFDSTPANVSTNIEGGDAVGFFKTSMNLRKTKMYIRTQEEKDLAD